MVPELDGAAIGGAVRAVLDDPAHRTAAHAVREEVRRMPSASGVLPALLDELLGQAEVERAG